LTKDYLKEKVVEFYNISNSMQEVLEISRTMDDRVDSLRVIIGSYEQYFKSKTDFFGRELLTVLEDLLIQCLELDVLEDKFSTLLLINSFALNHMCYEFSDLIIVELKNIIYSDIEKSDLAPLLAQLSTVMLQNARFDESTSLMQQALLCIESDLKSTEVTDYEFQESSMDKVISELFFQGNFALVESTSMEISEISKRHQCWKILGKNSYVKLGCKLAFEKSSQFKNIEARLFFLKGLADSIDSNVAEKGLILSAINYCRDDIKSIEKIMQRFALNELICGKVSAKKINRLNRTLNIQWAIDIKNSFSDN